jgi:hypothetical protein
MIDNNFDVKWESKEYKIAKLFIPHISLPV